MAGVGRHLGRRGIQMQGAVTAFSTGDATAQTTTTGTDTTPAVTVTYLAAVFIPANTTVTGLALLNGSAVAGNVTGILYDCWGVPVAKTASTAQAGIAGYQQVALTAAYPAVGPGLYFIGWQFNNVAARFRTHALGNFVAFSKAAETYGTPTAITNPGTFTTGVGPISSTY